MKLAEVARRMLENPQFRPLWWRWLQTVPEPVRSAERRARMSFISRQLPLTVGLIVLHAVVKRIGAFESQPLAGAWLAFVAVFALLWPLPWAQLGVAALRAAPATSAAVSSRLRALAVLVFIFVGFSAVALSVLLVVMVVVSRAALLG